MKEGMFLCGNIPFSCAFLCVLGTYREKVSQKVSVKVAGGTYVEKVHEKVPGEVGKRTYIYKAHEKVPQDLFNGT